MGLNNITKNKSKKFTKEMNIKTTFKDVAGIDNVR